MRQFCELLRGQTVTQVVFVHDYLQIVFTDRLTLTINNEYEFRGAEPNKFIGHQVIEALVAERTVSIWLTENLELIVGLADQDYSGPEAMVLNCKDCQIAVWQ